MQGQLKKEGIRLEKTWLLAKNAFHNKNVAFMRIMHNFQLLLFIFWFQ